MHSAFRCNFRFILIYTYICIGQIDFLSKERQRSNWYVSVSIHNISWYVAFQVGAMSEYKMEMTSECISKTLRAKNQL